MAESENRRRRARIDRDDPLNDLLDDPRDVARRRLERRLSSRDGGDSGASAGGSASASRGRGTSSSRGRREEALPGSVDHADLLGSGDGGRSSRSRQSSSRGGRISLPRPVVVALGVVVLVALFAGVGALEKSCSASGPETAVPIEVQQEGQEGSQEEPPQPEQADLSKLPSSIDQELEDSVAELAASDERVAHAVNTIGDSGLAEDEQIKMLELAVDDPQAIDFVAGFADAYPAAAGQTYDGPVTKGEVPLLMQWDARWGYTDYCGSSFALSGCCPTSLSMVYMGLTGKVDMTPYDMGKLATEGGYAVDYQGTIGDFLVNEASGLGLRCEKFYPDAGALATYLESGYTIICNVGPGDFTEVGHFFVITGFDEDGKLKINDPYSSVRSAKTWDVNTVVGQTIAFYAFKAA